MGQGLPRHDCNFVLRFFLNVGGLGCRGGRLWQCSLGNLADRLDGSFGLDGFRGGGFGGLDSRLGLDGFRGGGDGGVRGGLGLDGFRGSGFGALDGGLGLDRFRGSGLYGRLGVDVFRGFGRLDDVLGFGRRHHNRGLCRRVVRHRHGSGRGCQVPSHWGALGSCRTADKGGQGSGSDALGRESEVVSL